MTHTLIAVAVLIAVIVLGLRAAHLRFTEQRRPGRSAATAIPIEDYSDIDAAVRMEACTCRSHFVLRGEGPVQHGDRQLRVTRLECRGCGRERALYFDLTTLRH